MSAGGAGPLPGADGMRGARVLPDVSYSEQAPVTGSLDWVGMRGIPMPVHWRDPLWPCAVPAAIGAWVNLPAAGVKGIHMSRLYSLLHQATQRPMRPRHLAELLQDMVASHRECGTTAARVELSSTLVRPTRALVTEGLQGWASHSVDIQARLRGGVAQLWLTLGITYSSTCPCSASLSRQLMEEQFRAEHAGQTAVAADQVAAWLRRHGTLATPHSQRSLARICVALDVDAEWSFGALIGRAEAVLGTPVQGPVKRADEQEFARRNGRNLMFVEDAARLLLGAVRPHFHAGSIEVTHLESLHPHDAFAAVSWGASG